MQDLPDIPGSDPLCDPMVDAFESNIENPAAFQDPLMGSNNYRDGLCRLFDTFEASVEGTEIAPPFKIEPPYIQPETFEPMTKAPLSEGPPRPPESVKHSWISLEPPPAARPYLTPKELTPQSYRSPGRGGTGIRHNSSESSETNWCTEINQFVDESACHMCDKWGDHGASFEQCYYQYLEEDENQNNNDQGNDMEE